MEISPEKRRLMHWTELPERFRAGDFAISEEEDAVLRGFIESFYAAAEENGCVALRDFAEFMGLLGVLRDADTEQVQRILTAAFMGSARIEHSLPPDPEAEAFEKRLFETEYVAIGSV